MKSTKWYKPVLSVCLVFVFALGFALSMTEEAEAILCCDPCEPGCVADPPHWGIFNTQFGCLPSQISPCFNSPGTCTYL